ncbi:hypothetical protein [Pedobacter sp.]|uniref:hypothetical protein n=1 Tax=Pedobacter sp. TaxID=1411316 RepID=UPI003C383002
MIRRTIDVRFETEKSPLKINMIWPIHQHMKGQTNHQVPQIKKEVNQVLSKTIMMFNACKIKELMGKYNISDLDLYQMKLTRAK